MLISFIVIIISQNIHVSNHQVVHLEYIKFYFKLYLNKGFLSFFKKLAMERRHI